MTDETEITLTPEDKLQKAQRSYNAMCLGMLAYLKEHKLSVDEYVAFMGSRLAHGWGQNMTPIEFLKEEGSFLDSIGCNVRSLSGDESHAKGLFSSWPPDGDWTTEGFLSFWGLSQQDADSIWGIYGPIAEHLGLAYQWHRQGDGIAVTFTRQP